jgi:hypothetical protein
LLAKASSAERRAGVALGDLRSLAPGADALTARADAAAAAALARGQREALTRKVYDMARRGF